jgi:putative flippase GtrA
VGIAGHAVFASVAAYSLATVLNYLLNYHWSFGSSRPHLAATWRFAVLAAAGIAANAAFVAGMLALTHWPVFVIALIFAAAWPLVSFLAMRLWVFR